MRTSVICSLLLISTFSLVSCGSPKGIYYVKTAASSDQVYWCGGSLPSDPTKECENVTNRISVTELSQSKEYVVFYDVK